MTEIAADQQAMRDYIYSLVDLRGMRDVLDLGCGGGYDIRRIGQMLGDDAHLVGLDAMPRTIAAATDMGKGDPRCVFQEADLMEGIPFADCTFNLVFSKELLECVVDKDSLIREMHRVLRPGGQVLCAHWDWDSLVIDGSDKELVRRLIHTFGDWKQPWMTDCDSWMGRRLSGLFNRSGLFNGQIHTCVLTNTEYVPGLKGYETIACFEALVSHDVIPGEDYDRFRADVQSLADKGEFFFAATQYIYSGRKE